MTLSEVYEAVDLVRDVADKDCNIIFGAKINNESSGETEITVIATGFETYNNQPAQESVPEFKNNSADFKAFTAPNTSEDNEPDEQEEEISNEESQDKVEDISFNSKKPIVDDDTIPPFLRKLRR